ncbi:DMT family transporter [Alicyclobacillus fastidiosus]|uniref:DMT family transporter n=1 Tax=Alicyclobacillus fastidiosus TaxID=392011 RepID=UPI0024E09CBC|nr:EamA family transporter [Alicyclobacillus fastidiosus]
MFCWIRHRTTFPTSMRTLGRLALVGLFNTTGVFAIVYVCEQYVSSGYAALMGATMPFFVVLLGRATGNVRLTRLQSLGLMVGFLGVLLVAWPGLHTGFAHFALCTTALILSQMMAAVGALLSGRLLKDGTSSFVVNGFQLSSGGFALFLLAAITGEFTSSQSVVWSDGLVALGYLTVLGSLVASSLFFVLVKRVGALFPATWTYVSPVIAVIAGHLVLHERVYLWTIAGAAAILCGVLMMNLRAFQTAWKVRRHAPTAETVQTGR